MANRYTEIVKGSSDARYPQTRTNALAAATYVDSNNSYKFTYDQNGTRVTILDDQGAGLVRMPVINSKAYAMGNAASAISMFSVTLATLQGCGGVLWYSYVSTNGTDVASLTGMVTYAGVDKAGTTTGTITEVAGNQAKAVSGANTITIAWTVTAASNLLTFKAATTDSMTTTSANLVYSLLPLSGTVVTL